MLIYVAIVIALGWAFMRLPAGFLPVDDQGFITADVQTPPEASFNRTLEAVQRVEAVPRAAKGRRQRHLPDRLQLSRPGPEHGAGLRHVEGLVGARAERFGRGDRGRHQQEPGDQHQRRQDLGAAAAADRQSREFERLQLPPAGPRAEGLCRADAARRTSSSSPRKRVPVLQDVYVEGWPPAPQVELVIDREKAAAFGVTFQDVNSTISTNLGSSYINDFPNRGRMQRVIVQADNAGAHADRRHSRLQRAQQPRATWSRFHPSPPSAGSSARRKWWASTTILRCRISGSAKPGYTSGDAIAEMERHRRRRCRAASASNGPVSRRRRSSRARRLRCSSALSALVVFLLLAALYESWTIPISVLLVVPLGMLGAVAAVTLRGMPNDVYFTIGLVTIIGLAAKDAILIIEFAKDLRAQGKPLIEASGRGRPSSFPADPHDRFRIRVRRGPHGHRVGRERQEPAGARHRRDGRHDRRGGAGAAHGAGVLRRGAEAVYAAREEDARRSRRADDRAGRDGSTRISGTQVARLIPHSACSTASAAPYKLGAHRKRQPCRHVATCSPPVRRDFSPLPPVSSRPRTRPGRQEAGPRDRRLSGRRRHRHHCAHSRRPAAGKLRRNGAGRKQARRRGPALGRIRQERGAGRKRHAVHAGLSDHGLSAQLPLAELRPAAGFHPGGTGGEVDADLQCRRGRAGEREDAGRLRAMVQSKSGKGVVRDHCGGRHARISSA